eukprot:7649547-Ditylum_brightwellii.AAC.1
MPMMAENVMVKLRGGGEGSTITSEDNDNDATSTTTDSGASSSFTFPPSWLSQSTTASMYAGFMCYNGLLLMLTPQKVLASYGIQPSVTVENDNEDNDKSKKKEEEDAWKEISTDVPLENKMLRMTGSIEMGMGLL